MRSAQGYICKLRPEKALIRFQPTHKTDLWNIVWLWERPFYSEYAANGKLVLRFRFTDEGIEAACDITE